MLINVLKVVIEIFLIYGMLFISLVSIILKFFVESKFFIVSDFVVLKLVIVFDILVLMNFSV